MKAFKAVCSATVLALALSVPTYAGDILTPGVTSPPPPPPAASVVTEPALGEITYGVESTSFGVAETPGLIDLLWAFVSIF
jgi:hypothetical protein